MYQTILFSKHEGVATISLNRPEVFHALSPQLMLDVRAALLEAQNDASVRVVVLTATGEKAFCSGADLKDISFDGIPDLGKRLEEYYHPMIKAIRELEKPVICRMNGLAVGAGMSLAMACDAIIASKNAYLSVLFVGIGLMPDAGLTYFLPRRIGQLKAFELCSTGRKVFMDEAFALGLVNRVVPLEDLDEAVSTLASYYKNAATTAIGYMKKVLAQSYENTLEEQLTLEAQHQTKLGHTSDFVEGVMAFSQKRPAKFKGN